MCTKKSLRFGILPVIAVITSVAMTFTSCSDDDDNDAGDNDAVDIIGTWFFSYSTEESPSGYELLKGGSGDHFYGKYSDPLTWSYVDNRLEIYISEDSYWNLNGEVLSITKDKMVVQPDKTSSLIKVFYRSPNGDKDNPTNSSQPEDNENAKTAPYSLNGLKISLSELNEQGLSIGYSKYEFISDTDFKCSFSNRLGTYSYRRISDMQASLSMKVQQQWPSYIRTISYDLTLTFDPKSDQKSDFSGYGRKTFVGGLDGGVWNITLNGYYE